MSLALMFAFVLQTGTTPAIIERARLDPRADVDFHAIALPETVYVGQAVLYELGVFITDEVRQRLRQNPQFVPPELRSVLAYDLRDIRGARTVVRDGRVYEVHVFRRALFPVAPGRIDVPPARLSYQMPLGSSFFSREETRLLRSEPVTIVAIAPPTAGRPDSWNGAVGELRISAVVNAGVVRVGDPFVVTLRVSGEANVHLLPRPTFTLEWANVVPGSERVAIDSLASRVRGTKEFDWLVTPTLDGAKEIPAIPYAFFDPDARQYRIARSAPAMVRVGEGALAAVDSVVPMPSGRAALPIRGAWTRPSPEAPDRSLWYWVLAAVLPLPGLVRLWREQPRRVARNAPDGALRALAASGAADPSQVRAAMREALSARLASRTIPWGDPPALRRTLRHHGVTDSTIDEAMVLFARIDGAAYGAEHQAIADVAVRALAACELIDAEARGKRNGRRAGHAGAAAAVLLATSLLAQQLAPRALFERAVQEYRAGEPAAAASNFFAVASSVPAAAIAWANAGTASWAASDTARAVVGWQRALRLNPLDEDMRLRLTLVGTDAGAGRDVVWPIPRRIPAWLALALWALAWFGIWRGRHRRIAAIIVVAAVGMAAMSRVHFNRLTDSDTAVVALPAPLRVLPALGAEAGPTPLTGELVRVQERSGVWIRIVAPGERSGWIDGARLLDLGGRPLHN